MMAEERHDHTVERPPETESQKRNQKCSCQNKPLNRKVSGVLRPPFLDPPSWLQRPTRSAGELPPLTLRLHMLASARHPNRRERGGHVPLRHRLHHGLDDSPRLPQRPALGMLAPVARVPARPAAGDPQSALVVGRAAPLPDARLERRLRPGARRAAVGANERGEVIRPQAVVLQAARPRGKAARAGGRGEMRRERAVGGTGRRAGRVCPPASSSRGCCSSGSPRPLGARPRGPADPGRLRRGTGESGGSSSVS